MSDFQTDMARTDSCVEHPAFETASPCRPLTDAQAGIWYSQALDSGNPIFNTAHAVDIDGDLDPAALAWAVGKALGEADGLTVRFEEGDCGPTQRIGGGFLPGLETIDLRQEATPGDAADGMMKRDGETPLDPVRDPLVRQILFVLGDRRYVWYQRCHHLVCDAFGFGLLTWRIAELYTARTGGAAPGPGFTSYAALLEEEAAYLRSARCGSDGAYWYGLLAARPAAAGLVPGGALTGRSSIRSGCVLEEDTVRNLHRLADATGLPWPDVVTALVAAYLRRHIDGDADDGIVVGVCAMNRLGSAAAIPAMVVNVLPVPLSIDEDVPLARFIASAARQLRQARRHGRYRSERLRRDLGLVGGVRRLHGPLINVVPFDEPPVLPGARTGLRILGTGPVDDLTVTVRSDAQGHGLRLELGANPALYEVADIAAHVRRLSWFLKAAAIAPRLADVGTLTPDEHRRWVRDVNDTARPVDGRTLPQLIEAALARMPDAVAVTAEDRQVTGRDFSRMTEALSRRLTAAGVGRGDVVAVALPRSLALPVALVAVMRAGAAYLPIDPDHPPEHIARTFRSTRSCLTICLPDWERRLPEEQRRHVLYPDAEACSVTADPGTAGPEPARVGDAAYVICTSGSTGLPKGVVVEHHAIVNRLEWMRCHYGIGPGDRILQKTPVGFDVSVWEFFLPLISGATLVMAPPSAHREPTWIACLLRDERITAVHFVPSMLALFLAEPSAAGVAVRRVFCSGEELPAGLRDRFHQVVKGELHNLYGPTEAAVDVSYWPASSDDRSVPVPIGRPVWNTALYVLDRRLRPTPPGVAGDLYIAGRQLARGYIHQPGLTAACFVSDPFGSSGGRMYRTGDRARWRCDGVVEFLGRSDRQLKLNGVRIEAREIEAAVHAVVPAGHAFVTLRDGGANGKTLTAYVVPAPPDSPVDPADLRARLAARLPATLVPAVVVLSALPLTANGKIDVAALPSPVGSTGRSPATETERRLIEIFRDVLGRETALPLGPDHDFFALGGHSLSAALVVQRIHREWPGLSIALGIVFAHPTAAKLAARIDDATQSLALRTDGLEPVLPLVAGPDRDRPPLFCIHPAGGISWCYGGIGRALGPRAVYGMQALTLDPRQPPPVTLAAMAADYVTRIRSIRPAGPYHLLGWSVGGIIAQEIAVQLAASGEMVGTVTLLDSYPAECWRNEPDPDEASVFTALLLIAGMDPSPQSGESLQPLTRNQVIERLCTTGHPLASLPEEILNAIARSMLHTNRLVRQHRHRRFPGTLFHVRAALELTKGEWSGRLWSPYADAIESAELPYRHGQLMEPGAVACMVPVLRRWLDAGERILGRDRFASEPPSFHSAMGPLGLNF